MIDLTHPPRYHRNMLDEHSLELAYGFAFLILLFLGFYALTRAMAWLDRFLDSRKRG